MVWVEHDMQMVADLADRICVLESGTPIASGTPEDVLSDPRVVRAYLGARAEIEPSADGPRRSFVRYRADIPARIMIPPCLRIACLDRTMEIAQDNVRNPPPPLRGCTAIDGAVFRTYNLPGVRRVRVRNRPFQDRRSRNYGETRIRALGMLGGRLHALVFVETMKGIRVISFRRANAREGETV
ncbi:MAG: BrnT family toxin [Burkholderiaceae bacterium]